MILFYLHFQTSGGRFKMEKIRSHETLSKEKIQLKYKFVKFLNHFKCPTFFHDSKLEIRKNT